jgi:chemotaxis signal transduction protein
MTNPASFKNERESISQLLVFQIQDINFGVDARQVSVIDELSNINQDEIRVFKLQEVIPFKNQRIVFHSPKVLMTNVAIGSGAILVEAPDDIIFLNAFQVKAIPSLVLNLCVSNAIWGVFIRDGRTILVVDVNQLIAEGQGLVENSNI